MSTAASVPSDLCFKVGSSRTNSAARLSIRGLMKPGANHFVDLCERVPALPQSGLKSAQVGCLGTVKGSCGLRRKQKCRHHCVTDHWIEIGSLHRRVSAVVIDPASLALTTISPEGPLRSDPEPERKTSPQAPQRASRRTPSEALLSW